MATNDVERDPEINIDKEIERLLQFGLKRGLLEPLDLIPARNALLDLFRLSEPYDGPVEPETLESPAPVLERMLDYASAKGLLEENTVTCRDLFDTKIMGLIIPRQSEVARRFWETAKAESIRKATEDFYRMSIDANYIRMDRIRKNKHWIVSTDFGELEMTINLSKPEKDPKEIERLKHVQPSHYPKCPLCLENVGYAGRIDHPARQNLRVIPLELGGEPWYFQYSPYAYFREHCIVFSEEHRPMRIGEETFANLLEFLDRFPHYFIGSNADLPIVGGSILSHDHYQGGRHAFPMEKAPVYASFVHPEFAGISIGLVRWPMSVIRLSGSDPHRLRFLATRILDRWRTYSDESLDILAFSGGEPHNTITPIARKNQKGEYELDLVLRNNRRNGEHPDGIFHPHRDLHHIKKENIGLIEVMGLAILPGRLDAELGHIRDMLTGKRNYQPGAVHEAGHPLHQHAVWIEQLMDRYGAEMEGQAADEAIRNEVGQKFLRVLADAGVFKCDEAGRAGFVRFMEHLGARGILRK